MSATNNQRFLNLESASMDAAHRGIQALLILNGGACVAVLGLLGSLAASANLKQEFIPLLSAISSALIYFAIGAAVTVLIWICAYVANQNYAKSTSETEPCVGDHLIVDQPAAQRKKVTPWWHGTACLWIGLFLALVSFGLFVKGVALLACSVPDIPPIKPTESVCVLCQYFA